MRKEIEIILEKLTLEEKAELLVGKDSWHSKAYPEKGLGMVTFSDGPNGVRKEKEKDNQALGLLDSYPATCFPSLSCLASSFDNDAALLYGAVIGKEAQSLKVQVLLGPGVNIKRNPLGGRNFEYLSEDPYLAGKLATSYVKGVQSNQISACVKHFMANSQETRRMTVDSVLDERTLRELYAMPFEIVTKECHLGTVMSSYNLVNGEYSTQNHYTMVELLRKEFGFKGLVVTDWGAEHDRVKGAECFNGLEMPGSGKRNVEKVITAVKQGTLSPHVLNQNVASLIDIYLRSHKAVEKVTPFDKEVDHKMATKIAEDCLVLLRNEGEILPLRKENKVALFGDFVVSERIQGAGSSKVHPTKVTDMRELLKKEEKLTYVLYQKGFNRLTKEEDPSLIDESKWDQFDTAIVFMGLDEITESEGKDRKDLLIHQNQIALLKRLKEKGKKVVAVVFAGSAIDLSFDSYTDALLFCYLPGQGGNEAILHTLTGENNPSGRLSETFFNRLEDIPSTANFAKHELSSEYREGLYVGYRYGLSHPEKVRYPFGFGLSYSKFLYSALKVDDETIKVTIKNVGTVKGREAVQLYVGKKDSPIYRPKYELKGFFKITLEAGEEETLDFPIEDYTFRYFDTHDHKFETEEGTYDIYVGASSTDIRLHTTTYVEGVKPSHDDPRLSCYKKGDVLKVSDEAFTTLLGHQPPEADFPRTRRGRKILSERATVEDFKDAKSFVGRLIYKTMIKEALKRMGDRDKNTLASLRYMVDNMPVMQLSNFAPEVSPSLCSGLILLANGHFFKGLGKVLHREKKPD